jgi:two-component sensor histidine kinase/ABC-type amino acid transport substrate-binding protein
MKESPYHLPPPSCLSEKGKCIGRHCILLFLTCFCCLSLSSESLAQEKIYKVRGDDNYPPYEFTNRKGESDGFNVELLLAVGKIMGFTPDISLGLWSEVKTELFEGRIDMLSGMFFSKDRARKVDFSTPFIIVTHSLFVRRSSSIRSLDDLKGKRVLVEDGDIMHEWARKHLPKSTIVSVKNQGMALRRLAAGKEDCALLGKLNGLYNANRYSLGNIEAVGPPILPRRYCIAVPKGREELLARINEGLSILKHTGEYDAIYEKWFGVYDRTPFPMAVFVWTLIFLAVAGLAVAVWNWSLRRLVTAKTLLLNQELLQHSRTEKALKRIEEDLRTSLQEKDVLLKEIHHRVKNNLQIISSLLALQMDQLDSHEIRVMFTECQRRITSMALVHEELYQSKSLAQVNIAEYVRKLVASFNMPLRSVEGKVTFDVEVEEFSLPVHKAIPCGLILNELITNSLKHAFPDGGGTLTIRASLKQNKATLTIRDDGPGFPPDFQPERSSGLGMQLVTGLTSQLGGTFTAKNDSGALAVIEFFIID